MFLLAELYVFANPERNSTLETDAVISIMLI